MPLDTKTSTVAVNAEANAIAALLSSGYLRIYGGDKALDADTAPVSAHLSELRFAADAFRPAIDGVITSNPISPDMSTAGGGDASWYRTFASDGVTAVFDGTVGAADCNINIQPSVTVHPGGEFHLASISYRVRKS